MSSTASITGCVVVHVAHDGFGSPPGGFVAVTALPTVPVAFALTFAVYVNVYVPGALPVASVQVITWPAAVQPVGNAPVSVWFTLNVSVSVTSCVVVFVLTTAVSVYVIVSFGATTVPLAGNEVFVTAVAPGAATVIVAVAVSQVTGVVAGMLQIVYGYTYVPGVVPGVTVIVPSAFIVIVPDVGTGAVPGVNEAFVPIVTGLPPTVSFATTVGVVPPLALLIGP